MQKVDLEIVRRGTTTRVIQIPECLVDAQDALFFHRLFRVQKFDTAQQLTDSRNPGLNKFLNASSFSCNRPGTAARAIASSALVDQ